MKKKSKKNSDISAFTLIELLVVISVIALLAGILITSLSQAQLSAYKSSSQILINTLAMGVEQYKDDIGYYPASDVNYTDNDDDEAGAHCLVEALMGPDGQGVKKSAASNKRYGPYITPTSESLKEYFQDWDGEGDVDAGDFKALAFLDSFEQPILYYKAIVPVGDAGGDGNDGNEEADFYRYSDNDKITKNDPSYASRFYNFIAADSGVVFNPTSFILIGAGEDMNYFDSDDAVEDNQCNFD